MRGPTIVSPARLARGEAPLHPLVSQDCMNSSGPRRHRISLRLSEEEFAVVQFSVCRSGLTRSAYLRQVVLGTKPPRSARKPSIDAKVLVSILDHLGRIASMLRFVSVSHATIEPSVERDLSRSLTELRSLRPVLLRALGLRAPGS